MDEQPNLQNFVNEISSFSDENSTPVKAASAALDLQSIGEGLEIAGSGSRIRMKGDVLAANINHSDPSVGMSGQDGSQVKMAVGSSWLIANVRTMRRDDNGEIIASIDFLGEGKRDSRGGMSNFRRGVTRYPIPGDNVLPVSTQDLRSVMVADQH